MKLKTAPLIMGILFGQRQQWQPDLVRVVILSLAGWRSKCVRRDWPVPGHLKAFMAVESQ